MKKLEDLDLHFTVHADKWMEHWLELKEYKRTHGNCDCPTHCPENPKLGRWVHTQRHQRRLQLKGKKKSCMSEERVALLDSLGFSWEVRHKFERPHATWQQQFDELKKFADQYHHFCVPAEVMPHLHAWCVPQKRQLQWLYEQQQQTGEYGSNTMPLERAEALEAVGFTKDVDLGPDSNSISSGEGTGTTHATHDEHLDHSEIPGYGEALDAMIAVYDHSEEHANPVVGVDAAVVAPNDCTLQASGTKGDIFAPGMAMV